LQSSFLQIDVAKIVIHKADQPNTFFDFFDAHSLTSEDRAEIDFFAVKTDTSAASDVDGFVVERIVQFR
jgi:alcohol dehydrogenase class IV